MHSSLELKGYASHVFTLQWVTITVDVCPVRIKVLTPLHMNTAVLMFHHVTSRYCHLIMWVKSFSMCDHFRFCHYRFWRTDYFSTPADVIIKVCRPHYHRIRVAVFPDRHSARRLALPPVPGCSAQSRLCEGPRLSYTVNLAVIFQRENGSTPGISGLLLHINDEAWLWQMRLAHKGPLSLSLSPAQAYTLSFTACLSIYDVVFMLSYIQFSHCMPFFLLLASTFLSSGSIYHPPFLLPLTSTPARSLSLFLFLSLRGSRENKHKARLFWRQFRGDPVMTVAYSIKPQWPGFQSGRLYRAIGLYEESKDGVRPWIDITAPPEINWTLSFSQELWWVKQVTRVQMWKTHC